jgi:hypothetical protein
MHENIKTLIEKSRVVKAKRDADSECFELKILAAERYKKEYLYPRLKIATPKQYKKWLKGYFAKGCTPTHYYDYDWCGYIATEDIELKPLFGSQAINIIIPCGISSNGSRGHCNIFLMEDFSYMGWDTFIPVYKNTIV